MLGALVDALSQRDSQLPEPVDSRLFCCEECNVVYIDTERQTCSHCGEGVEQVPATLET